MHLGVEARLPRWPWVSRGGEASNGASPYKSRGQSRGVLGW